MTPEVRCWADGGSIIVEASLPIRSGATFVWQAGLWRCGARAKRLSPIGFSHIDLIDLRSELGDATERARLCEEFFSNVYKKAFPKPDQIETPGVWLPLLDRDHPPPAPILHLIIARRRSGTAAGGKVVGGIAIEYFRRSKAALATYLAVAPEEQRLGLGRRLLAKAIDKVSADNGGSRPLILAEVERPEAQLGDADRRSAQQRLSVIAALGGRRLEIAYVQPKLGPHQEAVKDLMLVLLEPGGQASDSVPASAIAVFMDEFFSSLEQRETAEYQLVLGSLPTDRIAVKELHSP
jgi:GNAT superfamily N-acetyltransferase